MRMGRKLSRLKCASRKEFTKQEKKQATAFPRLWSCCHSCFYWFVIITTLLPSNLWLNRFTEPGHARLHKTADSEQFSLCPASYHGLRRTFGWPRAYTGNSLVWSGNVGLKTGLIPVGIRGWTREGSFALLVNSGQIPLVDKKHLLSRSSWDITLHLDWVQLWLDYDKLYNNQ